MVIPEHPALPLIIVYVLDIGSTLTTSTCVFSLAMESPFLIFMTFEVYLIDGTDDTMSISEISFKIHISVQKKKQNYDSW